MDGAGLCPSGERAGGDGSVKALHRGKCENIGHGGWFGTGGAGGEGDYRSAFKSRDFRLYQTARLMVILGAEAQSVAVAWQVYALTHSALDLGYTGLALFLPGVFVMLAAGHAADRYDRRRIILLCYTLQACCTAALLWLSMSATALTGGRIWPIYAVLVGIGLGRAFSGPAASAMLPSLVPKEHFVNAVTWGATVYQIANMSGPAVGGILFTLPLAGVAAAWNGAPVVYAFTLLMLLGFIVLVEHDSREDGDDGQEGLQHEDDAGGARICVAGEAAAGVDLAGPVCGAAGRRDGAAADLCDGHSACRAARAGAAAGDAFGGGAGGVADDGGEADQATRRRDDAGVRGNLWCGDGGLWVVEEHLAERGWRW